MTERKHFSPAFAGMTVTVMTLTLRTEYSLVIIFKRHRIRVISA